MALYDSIIALTWRQLGCLVFALWLTYAVVLGIQRLWLSPVAHIPGPRLAALTQYYEFYYDIVLGGQYTFRIMEMHKRYGDVVRINPWEIHVLDPDFHVELYGGPSRPRDKWDFHAKQFGAPHCGLATIDHDLHKLRRSVLNPFFSTQSVRNLQPILEERVNALLDALMKWAVTKQGQPLNIMYPFSAFSNDVINEYAFARSDHLSRYLRTEPEFTENLHGLVEDHDFGREVADNLLTGTHMGMFVKHMNWALTLVNSLPESFSGRWVPGWGGFLKMKNDIVAHIAEIKASENTIKWQLDVSHPTIFHELLSSKVLPPGEKTPVRLAQEGQILVQAGTLTSAWTLTMAAFHLVHQPETLRKLRDELFAAMPDPDEVVPVAKLESLPYLRGVVKEALRHNIGTSGRLPRIAPTETLVCEDRKTGKVWELPPGTVVSMSPFMAVMNEDIFPDPLGFHPERWLDGGDRLDKYLHVFGGGTRICLGMALASAELHMLLAHLFRRWGSGGIADVSDDGDRRPGDVGALKIYKSTPRDCQMASDYFIPIPYKVRDKSFFLLSAGQSAYIRVQGSKGLRFVLELC